MKSKTVLTALTATLMMTLMVHAANADDTRVRRQAIQLYESGMFSEARTLFSTLKDDPTARSYVLLCDLKMQSPEAGERVACYEPSPKDRSLATQVYFQHALNLFDEQRYDEAAAYLGRVEEKQLYKDQQAEYIFKSGYCEYVRGRFPEARKRFRELELMPLCDYTAPARYALGFMAYSDKDFAQAVKWFRQSAVDPRFTELSEFYVLECEFLNKNYDYVVQNADRVYAQVSKERREHLARIISETYLVLGNNEKAREFYDLSYHKDMNRSDYFYAGSVMYAVEDYPGAIENYTRMRDRSDSLGQIANYHLGNAYIRTRNQVAALTAFRDAAEASFDPQIQEDAHFNYAKLAFDLNQDTSGFEDYIRKYSTSRKGDQIYGYMALTALSKRDYAAAVEAYDNIDELDDDQRANYMKANFLRGVQLYEAGAFRDAIPCLRAAAYYQTHQDRFNQLARYWLAESYYRAGQYDEAEKLYTDLYNLSALDGSDVGKMLPLNIAYSYFKRGQYATAARWFDNYIASGDARLRTDAQTRRADCDFAQQNYKAAAEDYGRVATAGNPDVIYPYYMQALSYGLSGDKKRKAQVLSLVEKASPSAPMYCEALYELGRAYMDASQPQDALRAFSLLRKNAGEGAYVAQALIGQGMVHRNLKEYEAALADYKQVVSLMRDSEYAQDALASIESIYQSLGQPQKYLSYLEENKLGGDKTDAEREALYFSTGEQLFLAGNSSQAIEALQRYEERYPQGENLAQAAFYMAESYRNLGEKEKACDQYRRSVSIDPRGNYAEFATLHFARLSYELEHYADAYEGYASLLDIARMDENKQVAREGMMRSAYRAHDYASAMAAAATVGSGTQDAGLRREARYVQAKSLLATSRRDEAFALFRTLAEEAGTPEGAEANYMIIKDSFDRGAFEEVENAVYAFAAKSADQQYWLANAFLVLGDSFVERNLITQARATYESIRDGYQPSGQDDDIQDNVKRRLERLASVK